MKRRVELPIKANRVDLDSLANDTILELAPKNLSAQALADWLRNARMCDLEHAFGHEFQDWLSSRSEAEQRLGFAFWFGEAARRFPDDSPDRDASFLAFIRKSKPPLQELGGFGQWMREAEIDPAFAESIIDEFLND